ncbi:SurA N-terminal domain-containing protein [Kordiimonas aestuarii]|uniref:SurA N-terminal domain-containing protein n=1 Tax=Kordiimonas aestuarii TaxID=1005925 RepID=UPI0021CE36F8|nr:SurA N-terminal domain-containing protein [Kordiimonas aestuarii]
MLFNLRGALDSIFVKVLLGLLIAAFAIWGIGPGMLAGSTRTVAKVGDTDVSTQVFANAVQRQARQLQQQFGGQMSTEEIIKLMNLDYQVLNQMVSDAAIAEHMRDMGLRATEVQLAKEIRTFEAFQAPDGSFSPEMMERALQSAGFSKSELYSDLRRGIARNQLMGSMGARTLLPRALAEELYVWQAERRRAAMINFSASDITNIAEPTTEELQAYYDASKATYMTPERRSYRYIMLTPAQFTDKVELIEDDITAAYESRRDEFVKPETRNLLQVSFPTEAEALAFISNVEGGTDFATAGAETTAFTKEEIALGANSYDDVSTGFDSDAAEAVFALEDGAMTAPIEGIAGWSVFKVDGITPGSTVSIDDARAEIETTLREEQAVDLMFDYLPELEDAIAEDGALTPVANKLDLSLATVTGIDAQGKNAAGEQVVTQQNEYTVMQEAFRLETGIEPIVKDIDPRDNTKGIYLVELSEVQEPTQQNFEDVSSTVRAAWTAEESQRRAGEIAEEAKTRLIAGEDAETVADELGGTSFDAKNVSRTAEGTSGLSQNIRRLIFDLPIGEVDAERAADGNGYVVVRVDSVSAGEPASNRAAVDALYDQLVEQFQAELFQEYQAYLLDLYEPEVHRNIVEQLFRSQAER